MAANPQGKYERLLKNSVKYYENCPGCKVDQLKEANRGYPIKEFFFVGLLVLCASLPISSLFPFIYFMVKDFHLGKTDKDIGFYAGYIGSSFMFGRFVTSVLWGMAADKFGRKPVMVIGAISVVVFNTMFGLSTNIWMAISTRFVLGSFNGILGPAKAYSSEICREEHQALGQSIVGTTWGVGLIIGPAIGGFLAQPTEKYPSIFSKDSLFGRFPYFLPCLCISIFAIIVVATTFWLPETLHKHPVEDEKQGSNVNEFITNEVKEIDTELGTKDKCIQENKGERVRGRQMVHHDSLLKNWPLMSSIIIYCVFSLHDIAYSEIFSLWAVSPKEYGGLNFTTSDVGEVLAISGLGLLIFQLLIFPPLANLFGPILVTRIGTVLSIPVLAIYPLIAMLSGFLLWLIIICASLLKTVLAVAICTGTAIMLNNSVPQEQRGAANGISMSGMSLFRALGPVGGGSLFAWAQRRQDASFLPGNQMVFFILNLILLVVIAMTFEPFLPRSVDKYQPNDERDSTYKQDGIDERK